MQPSTQNEVLREWRELGTTGSTDGVYGGDTGEPYKRKTVNDIAWLAKHWGIDKQAVREAVGGSIETDGSVGKLVDALLEHAPTVAKQALDSMNVIHLAIQSSCATGDAGRRRKGQARMVCALQDRGFEATPADDAAAKALRAEYTSALAALTRAQSLEAERERRQATMIHPGQLETHEADLEGCDSRDLRHMERYYQLWSCCGRGPKAPGCHEPACVPARNLGACVDALVSQLRH